MIELSREEVLKILRGVCDPVKVDPVDHKREWITLTLSEFEHFAAAIYEAGAKSERAVSDRLLETLHHIGGYKYRGINEVAQAFTRLASATIAEVEAMRKEKPE